MIFEDTLRRTFVLVVDRSHDGYYWMQMSGDKKVTAPTWRDAVETFKTEGYKFFAEQDEENRLQEAEALVKEVEEAQQEKDE